jgi:L-rhamnose isomerase/sugar isomerase
VKFAPSLIARLSGLSIEVPSWAFDNSATRFKVFAQPGVPRRCRWRAARAGAVAVLI